MPALPVTLFRFMLAGSLLLISYLSVVEIQETPFNMWDKANHALAFFFLLMLADYSFPDQRKIINPVKFLLLFFYGINIESIQSLLPYREASVLDLLANTVGLIGYSLIRFYLDDSQGRQSAGESSTQEIWRTLHKQTNAQYHKEPLMRDFFHDLVLQHRSFEAAVSHLIASKLESKSLPAKTLYKLLLPIFQNNPDYLQQVSADLDAVVTRDSACNHHYQAFCFFKGFHALTAYRAMHHLWSQGQKSLAMELQHNISQIFDVDIHPAATIGKSILFDHATGIVVGETAVIGNRVSIMQGVTLGGTGKESGDRHPKIGNDVLISVGATVLGNISIGDGAQIAAGSVVLKPVAPHTTVAGVPARVMGSPHSQHPALSMDHQI